MAPPAADAGRRPAVRTRRLHGTGPFQLQHPRCPCLQAGRWRLPVALPPACPQPCRSPRSSVAPPSPPGSEPAPGAGAAALGAREPSGFRARVWATCPSCLFKCPGKAASHACSRKSWKSSPCQGTRGQRRKACILHLSLRFRCPGVGRATWSLAAWCSKGADLLVACSTVRCEPGQAQSPSRAPAGRSFRQAQPPEARRSPMRPCAPRCPLFPGARFRRCAGLDIPQSVIEPEGESRVPQVVHTTVRCRWYEPSPEANRQGRTGVPSANDEFPSSLQLSQPWPGCARTIGGLSPLPVTTPARQGPRAGSAAIR